MERIVSKSIATQLKEKGFEDYVWCYYNPSGQLLRYSVHTHNFNRDFGEVLSAPTIPEVLDWLRTKKNIYIVVFVEDTSSAPLTYSIYRGTDGVYYDHGNYFSLENWGMAEESAIQYALNNLI